MLAKGRPGTFGTVGTSAGGPPSNVSDRVALSFTLIVARSSDALNVAANEAGAKPSTPARIKSKSQRRNHPGASWNHPRTAAGAEDWFGAATKQRPGARDLSRWNVATTNLRWEISRSPRRPTLLRTEVRAP